MKRPVGVTVIAVVNICADSLIVGGALLTTPRPHGLYLTFLIVIVLASIALSVGLLKLKKWARSLTILFSWLNLFNAFGGIIGALLERQRAAAINALLSGLFAAGVLWYLSRPEVIAAFQLRERLDLQAILNLNYRVSATEGTTTVSKSSMQDLEAIRSETAPVSVTLFGREIPLRDPQE